MRTTLKAVSLATVLVVALGCQPPPRELCSRTSTATDTRFAAQWGGTGDAPAGSQITTQNGHDFLAIDAQCRYWVQRHPDQPTHTGTLSATEVEELSEALMLDQWSSLVGDHLLGGCHDGAWGRFRFGALEATATGCPPSGPEHRIMELRSEVWAAIERLYPQGQPVEGPVRFLLYERDTSASAFAVWPLETPAAELAVAPEDASSASGLLAEGTDAEALRTLAARARAGAFGDNLDGSIPIEEEGRAYRLYVRDTVPFEDAQGRWE